MCLQNHLFKINLTIYNSNVYDINIIILYYLV
jgi:hypothetical protein